MVMCIWWSTSMNSFERFKEFKTQVEKQIGKHVKELQSNCGGEYMSAEFAQFLKENVIVSQYQQLHN